MAIIDVLAPVLGVIVVFIVLFLLSGIRVLKEWERMPVLRLGRYLGLKGPGLVYLVPLIDRAPLRISTRLDTVQFRTESTLTKDNVPVNVDSVLYMKPVDLEKAVLQVENYYQATQFASQTTLREVIGKPTKITILRGEQLTTLTVTPKEAETKNDD
jgi:regulator of protease activity HflC (stomatin/prohibitin superfamily)